jgi:DNA polymerase III subunit gamma/tau
MSLLHVNFARKWRSRTFSQIVGQDLAVRMLQNSLYLGHYFPVYLCAGQRGCGKTSTARIFAAAVNCFALEDFKKRPREVSLPCLQCDSCRVMADGRHPDFIEIDAASHTGVDNVRQIIEAASLMPVLGKKKIYLIDEAHMLSKAAFNAFLKILEEPPVSVIFILATTDVHKIIDTVRSRCFQLFFKPIDSVDLVKHLAFVCDTESLIYTTEALDLIAHHTQGSARDALNLLEQVRFSAEVIDKQAVIKVLGHISQEQILEILDTVFNQTPTVLLETLQKMHIESFNPVELWYSLMEHIQAALWCCYKVDPGIHADAKNRIGMIIADHSVEYILSCLNSMYEHELRFLKTSMQHQCIYMVLITMCHERQERGFEKKKTIIKNVKTVLEPHIKNDSSSNNQWAELLKEIVALKDPLVSSIFQQMCFVECSKERNSVVVMLAKKNFFFKEMLDNTKPIWEKLISKVFGEQIALQIEFEDSDAKVLSPSPIALEHAKENVQTIRTNRHVSVPEKMVSYSAQTTKGPREKVIDISDATIWRKTNLLLQVFPGRITETSGDNYV